MILDMDVRGMRDHETMGAGCNLWLSPDECSSQQSQMAFECFKCVCHLWILRSTIMLGNLTWKKVWQRVCVCQLKEPVCGLKSISVFSIFLWKHLAVWRSCVDPWSGQGLSVRSLNLILVSEWLPSPVSVCHHCWTGDVSMSYPASCPVSAGIGSSCLWPWIGREVVDNGWMGGNHRGRDHWFQHVHSVCVIHWRHD